MSRDCLLLNGNGKPVSFFPLSVVNWKTAIKLVITRNVVVIKDHADWFVRSPSITLNVPSIIMLQRYHKFNNYVKFSRSNIFLRDVFQCQYCSNTFPKNELTLDELKKIEPKLKEDVLKVFNLKNSVNSKKSYGGTSFDNIKKMIMKYKREK